VDGNAVELLETAYTLMRQGEIEQAEQAIRPLLSGKDPVITPRAIILQADIEHHRGAPDAALQLLTQASDTFRASREFPYLMERKGRQLEAMNRPEDARALYETLRDNAPPEIRAMGYLGLGRLSERASELVEARDLYRRAVEDAPWGDPVWEEAVELMGRLNVELIFSPKETPESRFYTVERGDNLISIGMKLNTTLGLLTRANNLEDTARLNLDQRLKYTPKDFFIIMERSTCSLYLFDNRGLFKRYRVGLGKPGHETALGKYALGNKQKDPVWFKPGFGPIPAGDPENELGTRWMPMVPAEEGLPRDLGIHGTIAPDTIGSFSSKGCARMLNHEVEELYDLVVRATPVEVVEYIHDHGGGGGNEEPDAIADNAAAPAPAV
jgi:tetratricopeptide (TPR) repeat protein